MGLLDVVGDLQHHFGFALHEGDNHLGVLSEACCGLIEILTHLPKRTKQGISSELSPTNKKNTETRRILQGGKNSMLSCFSTSGFEASTSKAYFLAEETLTRQPADLFQSRSASGAVPKKSHYRKDSSCSLDRIVQMVPQCLCKNISTHIWKPIQNFVAATETSLKSPSFTSPSKWVWGGTVSVNIEGLADSSG